MPTQILVVPTLAYMLHIHTFLLACHPNNLHGISAGEHPTSCFLEETGIHPVMPPCDLYSISTGEQPASCLLQETGALQLMQLMWHVNIQQYALSPEERKTSLQKNEESDL